MNPVVRVRDLLDLPERISKGDYVQSLTDGLRDPEGTVRTYAITDELVGSLDKALGFVSSALDGPVTAKSHKAIYLDGSFGSGKSHFLAVLDLLMANHSATWSRTELYALRVKHSKLLGKKLFTVPVHMLGPESFEAKLFGAYLRAVRERHPGADLPLLFRDGPVFDNAEQLRRSVGDAAFFARLNEGLAVAAPSFFGVAAAAVAPWDAASYDEARHSDDLAARSRLFTRLTETWLPAYTSTSDAWVPAARGYNEVARHAKSLGYDGVVLYLDEMILWLMGMISEPARMSAEFEKLVQVVEGQDIQREVPLVVFVARQRKPESLVDGNLVGNERATVFATMAHHEGRFNQVELRDSTLRAILPFRVCKPRSDAARAQLATAFAGAWADSTAARPFLAAGTATEADFRQVYPFSPALIDVLIALSDQLQRERTAVRILVEFLVEHAGDLAVGSMVPVGDLFDLIAGGEDAFDRAAQSAFQRARNLYLEKILPFLQATHKVNEATCQRMRPGHPLRVGCSACPVRACRNDNRLIKSALLAALVPTARPFLQLTVRRLVHLNFGLYGTAEEDIQVDLAASRLRSLASEISQVRVEGEGDPTVRVSLESVDVRPILEKVEAFDTPHLRRSVLRRLLWEELGLKGSEALMTHIVAYHCVDRVGTIRFGNVRTMVDADLRCPRGSDWQVVIDYPFDDRGYGPVDDERHLHKLRASIDARSAHTLVWLPTFFTERTSRDLGDLCRLDHLLTAGNLGQYLTHIPPDEHALARTDLEALRHRKEADLRLALAGAYGLREDEATKALLDADRAPAEHLISVDDGLNPRNPRELHAGKAVAQLAEQLLDHRFPNHPVLGDKLTPLKASRVVELLEKVFDADAPIDLGRDEETLLRDIAAPLGLCKVLTLKAEKLTRTIDKLELERGRAGEAEPSVAALRRWVDPDQTRGYPELAADLIGWVWASADKRVLSESGRDVPWPSNGKLPAGAQYISPAMPSAADFDVAIQRMAAIFGEAAPGKTLKAKNVTGFAALIDRVAASPGAAAWRSTPDALVPRLKRFAGEGSRRLETARAGYALVAAMATAGAAKKITALATVDLSGTSTAALTAAWSAARGALAALQGAAWGPLELLSTIAADDARRAAADALLVRVTTLLMQDEITVKLVSELRELSDAALKLLKVVVATDDWTSLWRDKGEVSAAGALAKLEELRAELERALVDGGPEAKLVWSLSLLDRPRRGPSAGQP